MNWLLNVLQCEIYYIVVTVMFVEVANVTAAQFESGGLTLSHTDFIPIVVETSQTFACILISVLNP